MIPPTLYHHPAACSSAARFAAALGDTPLDVRIVNIFDKQIEGGGSLFDINPLGQVSTLQFDDGCILTEAAAVLIWIQDHAQAPAFRREPGSADWYALLRWISFVGTELHKGVCWPLMHRHVHELEKAAARERGYERFTLLNRELSRSGHLVGDTLSVADLYLHWVLSLAPVAGLELEPFPELAAFDSRVNANPIIAALRQEDLGRAAEMAKQITNWTPQRNPALANQA